MKEKKQSWILTICVVIICCVLLSSCSSKEKTFDGEYKMTAHVLDGYSVSSNNERQYIKVTTSGDNKRTELRLELNGKYSLCKGYSSVYGHDDGATVYKFWINNVEGTMLEFGSNAYFLIYYYPDTDTCQFAMGDRLIYKFAK